MIGVALFTGYAGRQRESWVGTAARESLFSRAVFQAEAPLATRSLLSRSYHRSTQSATGRNTANWQFDDPLSEFC